MSRQERNREFYISPKEAQPYKIIFTEIERTAPTPIGAYTHFRSAAKEHGLDPIFYTPMAITSGGFSRATDLSYGDIIQKNSEYADTVAENLVKAIPGSAPEDFLIPSQLGKVKGWGQADYLMFFMHTMAGLDPKEAAVIESEIGLEEIRGMPGFTDASLNQEMKWEQGYKNIPLRYMNLIRQHGFGKGENGTDLPQNIQANILILDPQLSLGTNAERQMGDLLGIGEYVVSISEPSYELVVFRRELEELGANIVQSGKRNQIAGTQNREAYWLLKKNGFKFRQPGVLTAILGKEERRHPLPDPEPTKTSDDLWSEYYKAS